MLKADMSALVTFTFRESLQKDAQQWRLNAPKVLEIMQVEAKNMHRPGDGIVERHA